MTKSTRFSNRYRRGLTLIEVVAGLALMATILVALLLLKTQFTHQLAASNERLRAVAAADSLLQDWWAAPATFPINKSGTIEIDRSLKWETHLVPNEAVSQLRARVVKLDILSEARVIASVQLMLPLEHRHAQ